MKKLHFLEQLLIVLTLLLTTGGPLLVILSGGASEGEIGRPKDYDSTLVQYIFFSLYLLFFLLLLPRWKRAVYLISKEKWIFLLVTLAILSVYWTYAPEITPRRLIGLVGTTFLGVYLAIRYDLKQQMRLLAWTMGLAIGLSFLFAILLPKYGVMGGIHAGDWRGIYLHKNVLGKMMTLSVLLFWLLLRDCQRNRFWLWVGFFLSWILILLTTSSSALVNSVILIALSLMLATLGWRDKFMVPSVCLLMVFVGCTYTWISSNTETIFGLLGKDTTLTGRTNLWPSVTRMISQQPLWGYGYSGFWNGSLSEAAYVWRDVRWEAPHAHNGYLDLSLDLGLVGLSIFMISFLIAFFKSLVWIRKVKTCDQLWPILYLVYYTLSNLTESSLLIQNNVAWVVYVSIALSLQRSFSASLAEESAVPQLASL